MTNIELENCVMYCKRQKHIPDDRYTCDGKWYPSYRKPISGVITSFVDSVNKMTGGDSYVE